MKKKWMRALSLVSIVTMMLGCAISCGKTKEPSLTVTTEPSTAETTTAIETEPTAEPGAPVKLSGEPVELTSDFVLVCADAQNDVFLALVNTLKTKIKVKTGLNLTLGYANSIKEKEIVLGHHKDRAGCDAAYAAIGGSDGGPGRSPEGRRRHPRHHSL